MNTNQQPQPMYVIQGKHLMWLSVFSRLCVLSMIALLSLWSIYLNYKTGYNHARLVELSDGPLAAWFYSISESFFSFFNAEDPAAAMQQNGGMTWSIRIAGIQFTDPIAVMSIVLNNGSASMGFVLGMIAPIALALLFGRVFCSYVCPASLLFFTVARLRRLLSRYLYFPELPMSRGLAWGVLGGGLILALTTTHGMWALILPYFAIGHTIFHAIVFGVMHIAVLSIVFFVCVDLLCGYQFTCRYICPTGRLLGVIGRKSLISIRRDASRCIAECTSCEQVCAFMVNPKLDQTQDCTLCGECMSVCPTSCLSVGRAQPIVIDGPTVRIQEEIE